VIAWDRCAHRVRICVASLDRVVEARTWGSRGPESMRSPPKQCVSTSNGCAIGRKAVPYRSTTIAYHSKTMRYRWKTSFDCPRTVAHRQRASATGCELSQTGVKRERNGRDRRHTGRESGSPASKGRVTDLGWLAPVGEPGEMVGDAVVTISRGRERLRTAPNAARIRSTGSMELRASCVRMPTGRGWSRTGSRRGSTSAGAAPTARRSGRPGVERVRPAPAAVATARGAAVRGTCVSDRRQAE